MNTLLMFKDPNDKIDAIDEREFWYEKLLEFKDYIKGKFLTLWDGEMDYLDSAGDEEVSEIFEREYLKR